MLMTKYADMTKDELIKVILAEYPDDIIRAMEESFREGFLRGEDFGKDYYSAKPNKASITWSIEDVQEVRPDLTEEQVEAVLEAVVSHHDATIGVNWDVLQAMADTMFPDPLQLAINRLMEKDSNASWDECESVNELRECLIEAMTGYEPTEETYIFYADVLQSIGNHQ